MPGYTRQVTLARPTAVAVHDDGDVMWEPFRIEPLVYFRFFSVQSGRNCCLQGKSFRFRS
jgi:hypothetical protein